MLENVQRKKSVRAQKTQDEPVQTNDIRLKYSIASLPSNGQLGYPAEIEYRDILVRDEKELASSSEKTFQKTLNAVLKSLFKDPSFYDDLTIFDRDYLLLWVWANNYTTEKDIEATCPQCGHKNHYVIDLTKMDVKELEEGFTNPYPFELSSGEKVSLRLLTVHDEDVARKYCTVNKNEEEYNVMLALSIDFGVVMPLADKIKRIENTLTGKDMAFLRGFHAHFKYGIETVTKQECSNCNEVSSYPIPFSAEMFLPTLQGHFRKTV